MGSPQKKKTIFRGKLSLKKNAPLLVIILLLFVFGGLMFAAQAMMPFAIVNRFIEEFNTVGISSTLRSDNILDLQLSSSSDMFGLTDYQKSSLSGEGILNVEYGGGTILAYKNKKKEWVAVAGESQINANATQIAELFANVSDDFSVDATASPFIISTSDALSDISFKNPYTTASKTWRGGSSGWYDTLMAMNEQVRDLERSRFYYTGTRAASLAVSNGAELMGYRTSIKTRVYNKITHRRTINQYIYDKMSGTKLGEMIKANSNINSPSALETAGLNAAALLGSVSSALNVGCQALQLVAKAQTLIAGYQSIQQMNLTSGYLEAVQMVQDGSSDDGAAMNEYNENLLEKDPETGKSAMESAGIGGLTSGSEISGSDPSVQSASSQTAIANLGSTPSGNAVSRALMSAAGQINDIMAKITACNNLSSTLNIISTAITVGVAAFTGGIGAIVELTTASIVSSVLGALAGPAMTALANSVIQWIWEDFGKNLAENAATDWLGEDLGNALVAGGDRYIGSNGLTGGQTVGSKSVLQAFKRAQETVIAEEAEYQRSIRSPFDTSSQYTFLGSIVYNLVPLATTTSLGSTIKTFGNLVTKSATNLLPTASAIAETSLIDSVGDCANLSTIDGSGDPYCVGYMVSDISTMNYTPQAIIDAVYELGGIYEKTPDSSTGTFEIVENSHLDKYITFCGQRASDWGMADAGISEAIQSQKSKQWWRKIPLLGSAIGAIADIMTSGKNAAWITGEMCVAHEPISSCNKSDGVTNNKTECFWQNEGKYYQRFIEDQRLLENNGAIKKSSVTLALEKHYEENPLDNSDEGILARYSGLSKDDVITTLAFIGGLEYIASYDPSTRLAFGKENNSKEFFFEDTEETYKGDYLALELKYILYNDIRNRAKVV